MSVLISLLIVAAAYYLIYWIVSHTPIPEPIRTIVLIILAIIGIAYILNILGIHI